MPVLGRQHLACGLCTPAAEHAWQCLCWLTDLALLRERRAETALVSAKEAGLAAPMLHRRNAGA